jgi:hypothetical protein
MKHILEYEDHEITDLLGNLGRVGQGGEDMQFIVWAKPQFMNPKIVLRTDVIHVNQKMRHDEEIPKETQKIILEKIQRGEFKTGYEISGKELDKVLLGPVMTKEGLVDESEMSSDLEDFLGRVSDEFKERIREWPEVDNFYPNRNQVRGYLAPVGGFILKPNQNLEIILHGLEGRGIFLKYS